MWQATVLLLVCTLAVCDGAVVKGFSSSDDGFGFIGRFCFDKATTNETVGTIEITFTARSHFNNSGVQLAIYDDQPNSWPAVYHSDLPCQARLKHAKYTHYVDWQNGVTAPISESSRPRFWFVALAKCDSVGYRDISFNAHFTNIKYSDWNREFGANEKGMNTLYLVYFCIYIILFSVQLSSVRKLYSAHSYLHPLVKLLTLTILIELIGVCLGLIHYVTFVRDGYGVPPLLRLSAISIIVSRLIFILLLLLLSRGWTISNEELSSKYKYTMIFSIFIFTCVHVSILVWRYMIEDPAETSVPPMLFFFLNFLIAIYLVLAIVFIVFNVVSMKNEENPVKRGLYIRLLILFGLWFLLQPLVEWGVYALDDWNRDRVVAAIEMTSSTVAYIALTFLLWHSRAEEYFTITTPNLLDSSIAYEHL